MPPGRRRDEVAVTEADVTLLRYVNHDCFCFCTSSVVVRIIHYPVDMIPCIRTMYMNFNS